MFYSLVNKEAKFEENILKCLCGKADSGSTVKPDIKSDGMVKSEPSLKILFLCTGNSCRSQMAEGWVRHLKESSIEPYSAGVEKKGVDPLAVKVMKEAGVDISKQKSKTVFEVQNS
jgi:hypothetical protein